MRKTAIVCVVMISILIPLASFASTDDAIWDTLKTTSHQFDKEDSVIVFDRINTVYKENGSAVTEEEVLIHFRKEEASADFRSLNYDYNPRTAFIRFLDVKIYRSDGKTVDVLPMDKIITKKAPADMIFWNFDMTICPVPRLSDGDALYYKIERRGLNLAYLEDEMSSAPWNREYVPPQPDHFMDTVYFDDDISTIEKTYVIRGPKSRPLQFATGNGALETSLKFDGDDIVYRFSVKNREAYPANPFNAELSNAGLKLAVATHPSWKMKSKWAYEHNEPQFVISPEMKQQVDIILEGAKTNEEKMSRLLHWSAEEIRYLGLDMGEGEGHMVHRTDEIFRDRAGVCKDKAAILVSLLRAAGFESYFVMTLAMEQTLDVPADDKFNHGVVAVRDDTAGWVFLDPTWAPQNRPLFNHLEQEQPVLVACPEGSDLMHIPYSPPQESPMIVSARTHMDDQGNATSEINIETDGYFDGKFREALWMRPLSQRANIAYELLETLDSQVTDVEFTFTNPKDFEQPVKLNMTAGFPGAAISTGKELIFTPLLTRHLANTRRGSDYLYVTADPKKQKVPVEISCTRLLEFHETLELPSGFQIQKLPDPVKLDGPAASLDYKISQLPQNKYQIDQIIQLKKRLIQPDEYAQFKKVVDKINDLRKQDLVFILKDKTAKNPSKLTKLKEKYSEGIHLSDEKAMILEDKGVISLNSDGSLTERFTKESIVYNESGRDEFADSTYLFDAHHQAVTVIESLTRFSNGKILPSPETAINTTLDGSVRNAPDYASIQALTASCVGIEYGSSVRSVIERNTDADASGVIDFVVYFLEDCPIESYELIASAPDDKPVKFFLTDTSKFKMEFNPTNHNMITCRAEKIPPMHFESDQGAYYLSCPALIVSTYPDWDTPLLQVKKDFFDFTVKDNKSLNDLVDSVCSEAQGARSKLDELASFVNDNISPIDLPPKRFFYKMRTLDRIMESGYGYSWERLKVLAAMTESAGGEFELCLAAAPANIKDDVPTLNGLPVVYGRLHLNGIEHIVNLEADQFDDASTCELKTAIVTQDGWRWVEPHRMVCDDNGSSMELDISFDAEGLLEGKMMLTYWGGCTPYESIRGGNSDWVEGAVKAFIDDPEITASNIVSLKEMDCGGQGNTAAAAVKKPAGEVSIEFKGKAKMTHLEAGLMKWTLPSVPDGIASQKWQLKPVQNRQNPVRLNYPQFETIVVNLALPENWEVVAIPDKIELKESRFTFNRTVETSSEDGKSEPKKIKLTKVFRIESSEIPVENYKSLIESWSEYRKDNANSFIFRKTGSGS